jgi:uracil-DNA glycosylase
VLDQVDESWHPTFSTVKMRAELKDVNKRLEASAKTGAKIYPEKTDIFRLFRLVPLPSIKCVIIGQDPYQNGDACGVAFGGKRKNIPPSLANIWKEVLNTYPTRRLPAKMPTACLDGWCKQGVFLLNQCLTVDEGESDSHGGMWGGVILQVVWAIIEENHRVPWVLWGKKAQKLKGKLEEKSVTNILECCHPSPRNGKRFEHNGHFKLINELLEDDGVEVIDWARHDDSLPPIE